VPSPFSSTASCGHVLESPQYALLVSSGDRDVRSFCADDLADGEFQACGNSRHRKRIAKAAVHRRRGVDILRTDCIHDDVKVRAVVSPERLALTTRPYRKTPMTTTLSSYTASREVIERRPSIAVLEWADAFLTFDFIRNGIDVSGEHSAQDKVSAYSVGLDIHHRKFAVSRIHPSPPSRTNRLTTYHQKGAELY
jgi:hypothetical protein